MATQLKELLAVQLQALKDAAPEKKAKVTEMAQAIGFADFDEYQRVMQVLARVNFFGKLLPQELFTWWVGTAPNSPLEACIVRRDAEGVPMVGLVHRDDPEFPDCWHTPGSVLLCGETIAEKVRKLLNREMADVAVSSPELIAIYQHRQPGSTRQHEDCFLMYVELRVDWTTELEEKTRCKFFYLDQIPENTLPTHKEYVAALREWLGLRNSKGLGVVLQPIEGHGN